jgi:hypothetical protein
LGNLHFLWTSTAVRFVLHCYSHCHFFKTDFSNHLNEGFSAPPPLYLRRFTFSLSKTSDGGFFFLFLNLKILSFLLTVC